MQKFFESKIVILVKNCFRSDTCEGHYCFVSLTTSELVLENENTESQHDFVGLARPRYEILAGCLKVDNDEVCFILRFWLKLLT